MQQRAAARSTMSWVWQLRERSRKGRRRPSVYGPSILAPARNSVILQPMFAASNPGNTSTLARPATSDPGALRSATDCINAASNWSSPSIIRSGRRSRASLTASRTMSTRVCCALPRVEKDKRATQGCSPVKLRWPSAQRMAMVASCSADGSGFIAQSPYVSTRCGRIIRTRVDTNLSGVETPTPRIAARNTSPDVKTHPAITASTRPMPKIAAANIKGESKAATGSATRPAK